MIKLLHIYTVFLFPLLLGQIPTDYPPVRNREVPEYMQDHVKWFIIAGGILLLLLLVGYFMRLDKKIVNWFKK